jgi:hypothetical protein
VQSLSIPGQRGAPVAWVISREVEGRSIMLPRFSKMYAKVNRPWQAFEDIETAMTWVRSQLDAKPGPSPSDTPG